jgi:hypothetical protein
VDVQVAPIVAVVPTLLRIGADAEPKFMADTDRVQLACKVTLTVKVKVLYQFAADVPVQVSAAVYVVAFPLGFTRACVALV